VDWKSFFSLEGRMRRRHYIYVALIAAVILQVLSHLQGLTKVDLSLFALLVRLALIPPTVRRLHDMGYSGWFAIGVFALPYVALLLLFIPPDAGTEFGPDPRVKPAPAENPAQNSKASAPPVP